MKIRERIQVKYKILRGPTLLFSHKPFTKAIPLLFFWNHRLNHHGNTHHLFYLFFFFVPQNSAPLSPAREAAVLRHLPSSFPLSLFLCSLPLLKKKITFDPRKKWKRRRRISPGAWAFSGEIPVSKEVDTRTV